MSLERRAPMARGSSTLRRTPMARGTKGLDARTPIARTAPIPRTSAQPQRAPRPRKAARRTGATPEVRALVIARDGGLCVSCGKPATDLDHRQGRGAGGTKGEASDRINTAAALLTLCGQGNTDPDSCHGAKEQNRTEWERKGYRLPRNGIQRDPARVPVLTRFGWRLFGIDGARGADGRPGIPCPAPPDDDARNAAADIEP